MNDTELVHLFMFFAGVYVALKIMSLRSIVHCATAPKRRTVRRTTRRVGGAAQSRKAARIF